MWEVDGLRKQSATLFFLPIPSQKRTLRLFGNVFQTHSFLLCSVYRKNLLNVKDGP